MLTWKQTSLITNFVLLAESVRKEGHTRMDPFVVGLQFCPMGIEHELQAAGVRASDILDTVFGVPHR